MFDSHRLSQKRASSSSPVGPVKQIIFADHYYNTIQPLLGHVDSNSLLPGKGGMIRVLSGCSSL